MLSANKNGISSLRAIQNAEDNHHRLCKKHEEDEIHDPCAGIVVTMSTLRVGEARLPSVTFCRAWFIKELTPRLRTYEGV